MRITAANFFILIILSLLLAKSVQAEQMRSSETILDLESIEVLTPSPSKPEVLRASPTPTPNEILTTEATRLTISTDLLDFGILSATTPVVRTADLSLQSDIPTTILISKDRSMTNKNLQTIPDTTCDNGLCTNRTSEIWNSTLTFGFGLHCDSEYCRDSFPFPDSYIPIPSKNSTSALILSKNQITNAKAKMNFKVTVPGTLENGLYENTLTIVALPKL